MDLDDQIKRIGLENREISKNNKNLVRAQGDQLTVIKDVKMERILEE